MNFFVLQVELLAMEIDRLESNFFTRDSSLTCRLGCCLSSLEITFDLTSLFVFHGLVASYTHNT